MPDPDEYAATRERIKRIEEKALKRLEEAKRAREARTAELRSRDPKRRLWLEPAPRCASDYIADEREEDSTDVLPLDEDFTREPAGPGAIFSWPEIKILQLRGVGTTLEGDPTLQFRDGMTRTLPVDAGIRALMRRPDVPESKARGVNVLVDIQSVAAIAASNADEGQKQSIVLRALDLLERAAPLHGLTQVYGFLQFVLGRRMQAIGIIAEAIASLGPGKAYAGLSDESALFETAGAVADTLERIAKHEAIEALVQSVSVAEDLASIHIPDHMREGIFSWDAALADELEKTGKNGKKLAETVRTDARKRTEAMTAGRGGAEFLREWIWPVTSKGTAIPFGFPMLRLIARAIWLDVVQPKRKRIERKPVALVYAVHEAVTDVLTKTTKTETPSGQRMIAFPGVPLVDGAALTEVQARGVELLRSRTSFRLMNWLVAAGHTRAINEIPDPRMLTIDGSWNAIAESLGMTSKRAPEEIRAIAEALAVAQVPLATGERRTLLMLRDAEAATGRRQSSIKIILGPELLPDYVFEMMSAMPKGRIRDEAARLVPMIGNVPVTGARPTYGAQEGLAMLFVRELRAHARELRKSGLVPISDRRWMELAKQVHLPGATLPKVLDRWAHDGDDAPALLIREGDGYTLADSHAPAREFIAAAGKRSEEQAERGRHRVSRKERPTKRRRG